MKLFGREKAASAVNVPERRGGPRTRVDCMALFVMPSGNVPGRVFDISEHGARVTCERPPGKGVAAILEWPHGEAYCHITWAKPGMCGVQFDRAIPAAMLAETIEKAPSGSRLVHAQDSAPAQGISPGAPPRLFC